MPRYTLTVILNDNTELTFDSKRAGGLDHLFEQVGSFISKVGNDTVRECLLTAVPEDQVLTDAVILDGHELPAPFNITSTHRQSMYADHMAGLHRAFSPHPLVLEQVLSAEPADAEYELARRLSLATMALRYIPTWADFFRTEAYLAYLLLLDSPFATTPEAMAIVNEGYNTYHQAMIDFGTERNLINAQILRK